MAEVLLVRMPAEMKSRLRLVARSQDRSMSAEVRCAVSEHIEREARVVAARVPAGERAGAAASSGAAAREPEAAA